VVLSFDGKPVERSRQLPRLVAATQQGKDVPVTLWRDGKEVSLNIKIALLDPTKLAAERSPEQPAAPPEPTVTALGLSLAEITPQLRQRFQLGDDVAGVVVTAVAADGKAAEEGVTPGDVITMVGREAVAQPADVVDQVAAARQAQRRTVLLRLERKGSGRFVALPADRG
jgi:serine protease Do